jgi:preprotein translocase subunit SecF
MSKPASAEILAIQDGPLNIYKYRWVFLIISILFLIPGVYFIAVNMADPEIQAPLRLGIDFKGGTLLEYGFSKPVSQPDVNDIREVFDRHGYTGSVIQIQEPRVGINKEAVQVGAPATTQEEPEKPAAQTPQPQTEAVKPVQTTSANKAKPEAVQTEAPAATAEAGEGKIASIVSIRAKHMTGQADQEILKDLESKYGNITLLQKNSIGPALAKELLSNGLLALVMAYILIVGYLTFRFQFDFAVCAVVALLHDTLFLIGMFAMFSRLFNTEVDSLFITSVLTVIGFSVHDTIVVFDRIRENLRVYFTKKVPFVTIVNMSVNQTLARSINTSLTALLTMVALYLFGGETTRDFVLAIIIGIAAGTYSSIFNASVLLAMWRNKGAAAPAGKPATA